MKTLLDLFCGAGGATRGYKDAGFYVVGVDINPQSDYCGDEFIRADALAVDPSAFDFVHASPPCQADCTLTAGTNKGRVYPNLTDATRDRLRRYGVPYVLENPTGRTSLRRDAILCGEMFGLDVIRHRIFEFGGPLRVGAPEHRPHRGRVAGMRHGQWFEGPYFAVYGQGGGKGTVVQWQKAMGIEWTADRRSIAEAIPPAYTRYIGRHLLMQLNGAGAPVAL
jgi:hypothetical protein